MDNYKGIFIEAISACRENLYECCKSVLNLMEGHSEKQEQLNLFRGFLTQFSLSDFSCKDGSFMNIEDARLDSNSQIRIQQLKNQLVQNLILNHVEEPLFYQELWERMHDPLLLSSFEQRAAFLQFLWLDKRIPYFNLGDGLKMDDETFQKTLRQITPAIQKANFIMSVQFSQKTQRSSLLLEAAETLPSEAEHSVYWAVILSRLEHRISLLHKQLEELQKETGEGSAEL